jgi:hypothetical protein
VTILGCKKDLQEFDVVDDSTSSTKDNSDAESIFSDMKKGVEQAAYDEGRSGKKSSYSFGAFSNVSIVPSWSDTATWPKIMTIDFGATNCTGNNGVNRRGQLVITLTERYRHLGSMLTVQPQDYFINDLKVEGTKTLTNNGDISNNHLSYSVDE